MTHKRGAPKGNASFFFSYVASDMIDDLREKLLQSMRNCFEMQSPEKPKPLNKLYIRCVRFQVKRFMPRMWLAFSIFPFISDVLNF